jgi:leader peptidase (prepilin peptidase) / N-methyltransferase
LVDLLVSVFIVLIGWACGALVNYLADVLPARLRLEAPFCPGCGSQQPILNYLFWPRRCADCGRKRPARVWIVEAIAILAALWLWHYPSQRLGFFLGLTWLIYFGLVSVIDLEHRLILLPVSIVGAILALGSGIWMKYQKSGSLIEAVSITLLGGVAGFLVMLVLYYIGAAFARRVARKRGETLEEEALGLGDVHLSLILGLLLGWPAILAGLVAGVIFGGIASLVYLAVKVITHRYQLFLAIPYGPFLIAGAVYLLYILQ